MSSAFSDNVKVADDLRSFIDGDVLSSNVSRQLYSTAACIYELTPLVIVVPRHADDVQKTVKYSSETGIPITARGAGSGLAGAALGTGIILDFTKYMNKIISIDGDMATVQPGLIYGRLNKNLRSKGLHFAPDPSSGDFCSIGGMLGTNAAGPHTLKYGSTKDWIESLSFVTANAESMTSSIMNIADIIDRSTSNIPKAVFDLINDNKETIAASAPNVNKNSSGYNVFDVIKKDKFPQQRHGGKVAFTPSFSRSSIVDFSSPFGSE